MPFLSFLFGSRHSDEPFWRQNRHAKAWLRQANRQAAGMGLDDCPIRLSACGDTVGYADATAAFGESAANPIPVNAIEGTFCYLQRLTSAKTGKHYLYHRLRSVDAPGSGGHRVDRYELLSMDGKERRVLFVDMYCPRRSQLAPRGMVLEPFPKSKADQQFAFWPLTGTNMSLQRFPHDVPAAVCEHLEALGLPRDLAIGTRRGLEDVVRKIAPLPVAPDEP